MMKRELNKNIINVMVIFVPDDSVLHEHTLEVISVVATAAILPLLLDYIHHKPLQNIFHAKQSLKSKQYVCNTYHTVY